MQPYDTVNIGVARMQVAKFIQLWLAHIRRRCAENTYKSYIGIIWRFRQYVPEDPKDLTCEHIENYLQTLNNKSPRTRLCHLMVIKSFCRFLSDYHGFNNVATKVRGRPVCSRPQRVLTEEEYTGVLNVCQAKEKILIQILGCMGLRASELLNIKPADISPDKKFLRITGKGDKYRPVPLSKVCQEHFSQESTFNLLKSTSYLQLNRLCHRLAKRADIPLFAPHALRRFFATRMIANEADIYRLSKVLGHSSIELTQKLYIQFSESQVEGFTDCLDE